MAPRNCLNKVYQKKILLSLFDLSRGKSELSVISSNHSIVQIKGFSKNIPVLFKIKK
jgi:hypothetical protein